MGVLERLRVQEIGYAEPKPSIPWVLEYYTLTFCFGSGLLF